LELDDAANALARRHHNIASGERVTILLEDRLVGSQALAKYLGEGWSGSEEIHRSCRSAVAAAPGMGRPTKFSAEEQKVSFFALNLREAESRFTRMRSSNY